MFNYFQLETTSRHQTINISGNIENLIEKKGIKNGIAIVYTPHTTCGIMINEWYDTDVQKDFLSYIKKLVPADPNFKHMEGNSDSHLKSLICGKEKTIIVENVSLKLGTWDSIYFMEADGPRNRKVYVKIIEGWINLNIP